MDEESFDPCECIWSHQAAMRRLLAFLRQSQSHCTDNECLDELPSLESGSEQNFFLMTFLALAVGFLLFVFRPPAIRNSDETHKRRGAEPDDSAPPPLA